jgi:hypothetical protein
MLDYQSFTCIIKYGFQTCSIKMSSLLRLKLRPGLLLRSLAMRQQSGAAAAAAHAQYQLPPSWQLLAATRVPEFDIDAIVLEHSRTRAQYLHMAASDSNNAFSVSFRCPACISSVLYRVSLRKATSAFLSCLVIFGPEKVL